VSLVGAGCELDWPVPAKDLHTIFGLAGLTYGESKAEIERTVGALDFVAVRKHLPARTLSIQPVHDALNAFF
jgi:hypothetical protein